MIFAEIVRICGQIKWVSSGYDLWSFLLSKDVIEYQLHIIIIMGIDVNITTRTHNIFGVHGSTTVGDLLLLGEKVVIVI